MRQTLPPELRPPRRQAVRLTEAAALAALGDDWRQWPQAKLRVWLRISPWAYAYCDRATRAEILDLIEWASGSRSTTPQQRAGR